MPRFDGTGPKGEGEMTGCGRGYCIVPLEDVKSPIIKQQLNSDTSMTYSRRTILYRRSNRRRRVFGRRCERRRYW